MALKIETPLDPETERIAEGVVESAFAVHAALGPGLLESTYEKCLAFELASRGFEVTRQVILPIEYLGQRIDDGFRIDLLVNRRVIIEVKATQDDEPIFKRQVVTYVRLSHLRLGFLINFNKILIRDGMSRIVV